jgi:arsenate reductase (thioredoxin)
MAEAILNDSGNGKFVAYSAGSKPKNNPHPKALETIKINNLDKQKFRSESWNEFSLPDSPKMDLVITVCSNAANESCPIFPGTPKSMHWDIDDPAREFDSDKDQAHEFKIVFNELKN